MPGDRRHVATHPTSKPSTLRPKRHVASERSPCLSPLKNQSLHRRVVTHLVSFFPGHCAIGQAASNTPSARFAIQHATALVPAGRPCETPWIENVSGDPAEPWTDGRSEQSNIKRPSAASPFDTAPSPTRRRRGHHPSDRPSPCHAGRQLSRSRLRAGLLEQPLNP
jgi:hypothetical protein